MEGIASPGRLRTTALVLLMCLFLCLAKEDKRTNVLLIMFDDLRPQLSIYGQEYMITPNFERLAKRSVVFDNALCQVAVCNPSRNSFLTGLRPDTTGSYNFETSILPHIPFPALLVNHGYNTAASGKIEHSRLATEKYADAATTEKTIWSHECWENGWYKYQGSEKQLMNSSVTPDKKELEDFRDWQYTTRTLQHIRHLSALPQPFLSAIGFKLPHLELHVPHQYFSMYKDKAPAWKLSKRELKFPSSLSELSYRFCEKGRFHYMNNEGSEAHNQSHPLRQIDKALPSQMHDELMMGYSAAITYLDDQLGRILDLLDELHLWDNTTVILTSDHGMHNGEKGIW
ncbi:alkaline-phosphatase-like protein [Ochromonadaceae sp. CCMP2298]|nr:alkaline-phosphatase-like protein [Ochromonadaceae sp. CCMP2298]